MDQKKVVIVTRGKKSVKKSKIKSVHLRSLIQQTVLSTKNELCPAVEMKEFVIHPKDAVEYPIDVTQAKCVSIKYVASTIKNGEELVVLDDGETHSLKELLHFDPYANMKEPLLRELYEDPSQHHHEVSDDMNIRIAECAHENIDDYVAILEPSPLKLTTCATMPGDIHKLAHVLHLWREKMGPDGTRCHLHHLLDQHSIFAGRSPLDVAKGKSTCTGLCIPL